MTGATILVSLAFAVTGAMCSAVVMVLSPHPDADLAWLVVTAGAGSFLTAVPIWGLIVRPGLEGFWRGLIAGGIIGIVAHPVTWCLLMWFVLPASGGNSGEPIRILAAPLAALFFSFWSLLILGWLTFPVAATVGGFLGLLVGQTRQMRATREEEGTP